MAQIYLGENDKCYHTKFEIGDIVRIKDVGWYYPSFYEAFKKLGIQNWEECITLDKFPNWEKENWVVSNILVNQYRRNYDILYLIKNTKKQLLVINENGLTKHMVKHNPTYRLKEINKSNSFRIKVVE